MSVTPLADFVRERWLSEGCKPFGAAPSLLTGEPPRSGGSLLLDSFGAPMRREPPRPLQRLQACEFADAAVGLLMGAPLLSRQESLDLSYGLLGDAGAEGLSQSAAKLGQLRQLTLVDTAMGATARETLRALGPHVKVENRELNPNDSVDHFVPSAAGDEFVYVFNVGTGSPPTPSPSGWA